MASRSDEFVSNKKEEKKLSTNAKVGIGAGILAFGGIVAAAILCKGKTLKPANFAEHIDFKPAKTMEEAVEFAKKHLGVEKFNLENDVEMANWVNEGLVNISNRFKGKAHMPKNIIFDEKYFAKSPEAAAYCHGSETIAFNKKYFSNDLIKDVGEKLELLCPVADEGAGTFKNIIIHGEDWHIKEQLFEHYDKLLQNPQNYSRFDAAHTGMLIDDYIAAVKFAQKHPTHMLKKCANNSKAMAICEQNGIDLSIEKFNKLSKEQQDEFMKKFYGVIYKHKIFLAGHASHRGNSKFDILYHEMGHLLHNENTSIKDRVFGILSSKAEKAFLADIDKLDTAGKISWYAQTNPKEFVAETFNALCAGKKLPDDVMKLYQYYKGSMLPNM